MSNKESNRVLNRVGAREVTQEELERIIAAAGGPVHTEQCTFPTSYKISGSSGCDVGA